MPKVSVLIPAYNVESYIKECIDSVLAQSLQNFEVICVDDCSTDDTLAILRDMESRDARFHVICHEKNLGQAAGRNHALDAATGEYVYMLDADDKILPNTLQELYETCKADALDVIGFETENFSEDAEFERNVQIPTITYENTAVLNGREALTYCMETESFSLSTPTFMMRRAYLNDCGIRFTEGILHEDVGYILELLTKAARVRFLHRVYFLRRIRKNSTMTRAFTDKNIEGYLKSFYKSFDLEEGFVSELENNPAFAWAYHKWQRDIWGRVNQLYEANAESVSLQGGGHVDEEIRRAFHMLKLGHFRTKSLGITECYLCGTGQYTERAIQAVGTQGIIVRGIISLEKGGMGFCGFPLISPGEVRKEVPVILSVSHYKKQAYVEALSEYGVTDFTEMDF